MPGVAWAVVLTSARSYTAQLSEGVIQTPIAELRYETAVTTRVM
jgi:hypothetical protein